MRQGGRREYSHTGFVNRAEGMSFWDDKMKGNNRTKGYILWLREKRTPLSASSRLYGLPFSYLTMKGKESSLLHSSETPQHLLLVIAHSLRENGILSVRAFFDNDEAGRQALQVSNFRHQGRGYGAHYARYKDLNEYHVAQRTELKQVIPPRKRGLE